MAATPHWGKDTLAPTPATARYGMARVNRHSELALRIASAANVTGDLDVGGWCEPRRVCRGLQPLRGWSDDEADEVVARQAG